MSDGPEKTRFSYPQIAMAGLGAAVAVLIVIVLVNTLW
jgi:hypothetical protein